VRTRGGQLPCKELSFQRGNALSWFKLGTSISGEADDFGQLLVGCCNSLPMLDLHMYSKVPLHPTWPRTRALDEFQDLTGWTSLSHDRNTTYSQLRSALGLGTLILSCISQDTYLDMARVKHLPDLPDSSGVAPTGTRSMALIMNSSSEKGFCNDVEIEESSSPRRLHIWNQ
jgi:hypothetical protein